jgi:hypothetical protein
MFDPLSKALSFIVGYGFVDHLVILPICREFVKINLVGVQKVVNVVVVC